MIIKFFSEILTKNLPIANTLTPGPYNNFRSQRYIILHDLFWLITAVCSLSIGRSLRVIELKFGMVLTASKITIRKK